MATPVPVSTLTSALLVVNEAATELTAAQTNLAAATTSLNTVQAQSAQVLAAINALNLKLANPITGP